MDTAQRVQRGLKPTLYSITTDLNNNDLDCLYYATEDQISSLISKGSIDEDYSSTHQEYQEEMRILLGTC